MSITSPTAERSVWDMARAWTLFHERSEKCLPTDVHLTPSQKYGVLPQDEYMKVTGNRVVLNLTGADNMKHVEPGDFIIHLRSFQGGLELSRTTGKVSNAYTVLKPSPLVSVEYFRHFMKSSVFVEELASQTDQLRDGQSINFGRFSRLSLPLPPMEEQRRIAAFLDREIGEMDAMVAKLDGLIETLRSRRRGVIALSLASEVSAPLSLMADVTLGKMLQPTRKREDDLLLPYLRAAHVQPSGTLDLSVPTKEMWFAPIEAETLDIRAGDAVLVEGGAGYGRAAYIGTDMPGWAFQNSIIRLRGADDATGRYLTYALLDALDRGAIAAECNAATFAHFTTEKVSRFRVPFHPASGQRQIADHLDRETAEIDAMIARTEELKSLIAERRSALITDVVTGRKQV